VEFCEKQGIIRSLGETGVCWDNAVSDTFPGLVVKSIFRSWREIVRRRRLLIF
jgi:hypothetical protein